MRYLGIDLGNARSGFAVGSDETAMAAPVGRVEHARRRGVEPKAAATQRRADQERAVADMIARHDPGALVLGLPVNMDGSEGPAALQLRAFADRLRERFGLRVHLVDERLSSDAADHRMARTGLTHGQKKARRDSLAAAEILQRFLDARRDSLKP